MRSVDRYDPKSLNFLLNRGATCDARQDDLGLNDVRERRTEFGIISPFSSRQLGAGTVEDFPVLAI